MTAALAAREPTPRPPDVAGELVGGVTARWGPHALTEARARDLGLDLQRWPLDEPVEGWQQDAVCRGVASSVADQLSEVLSQLAASPLVGRFCAGCPVRAECFQMGRTTAGFGLHGGIVLREGHVAPWRTAVERSHRAKLTETTEITMLTEEAEETELTVPIEEAEITMLTEEAELTEPPKRRRGQRPQPRRLTRAQRRR